MSTPEEEVKQLKIALEKVNAINEYLKQEIRDYKEENSRLHNFLGNNGFCHSPMMSVANISTVSTDASGGVILTSPSPVIPTVPVNIEEHSSTVPISDDTSGDSESTLTRSGGFKAEETKIKRHNGKIISYKHIQYENDFGKKTLKSYGFIESDDFSYNIYFPLFFDGAKNVDGFIDYSKLPIDVSFEANCNNTCPGKEGEKIGTKVSIIS